MPEPAPPDLLWKRFWFQLEHEVDAYLFPPNPTQYYQFRPGEIAYAPGVVRADFPRFLMANGYTLTADEKRVLATLASVTDRKPKKEAKPVLVLRRLGGEKYLVCRMASWGGSTNISEVLSPLLRYFAISMSPYMDEWPPGTKYLRCTPSAWKGMAVMAMPVMTEGVRSFSMSYRRSLNIGQLERLEAMIRKRQEDFSKMGQSLRVQETRLQKLKAFPFWRWPADLRASYRESSRTTRRFAYREQGRPQDVTFYLNRVHLAWNPREKSRDKHPPQLPIPPQTNLLNWMFTRTSDELVNGDIPSYHKTGYGRNVDHRLRCITPLKERKLKIPLASQNFRREPGAKFQKGKEADAFREWLGKQKVSMGGMGSRRGWGKNGQQTRTICTAVRSWASRLRRPLPVPFGIRLCVTGLFVTAASHTDVLTPRFTPGRANICTTLVCPLQRMGTRKLTILGHISSWRGVAWRLVPCRSDQLSMDG